MRVGGTADYKRWRSFESIGEDLLAEELRWGNGREDRRFFPLTSLQIGDLQSYLSHLTLFLAIKSKKLYILVDNRPWLIHQDSRATHLWQLMVTKSRLSPFANTRSPRVTGRDLGKILEFTKSSRSVSFKRNRLRNWFSLIDAALNYKKNLHHVKKLKDSFLLSNDLHCPLNGCIVFEVEWKHVRGINYINELQTDTSLALEVKLMKRWEFDSIEQASSCIYLWYTGTCGECSLLQDYLEGISCKDVFYDAQEDISSSSEAGEELSTAVESHEEKQFYMYSNCSCSPGRMEDLDSPFTPPASGPYKRRKIIKPSMFNDVDGLSEEAYSEIVRSPSTSVSSTLSGSESDDGCLVFEANTYRDVLILFRFDDHDLPFKLKEIIMSDLRLLTLLEYGLPSWVIFLQSYPVFCQIYRPWMCPLARAFYVLMSIITVLIGFYDLYKNVPILKATAARLFGPFFNWIESWEMVSRIRYLGTMLFLHNFEKALMWFLMIARATKSLFSVLTKPIAGPIMELFELIFPMWNACFATLGSLNWVIWNVLSSSCNVISSILDIVIWPFWFAFSTLWTVVAHVIYPVVWLVLEIVNASVRLIVTLTSFLGMLLANACYLLQGTWSAIEVLFQISSPSEATAVAYEVSIWRSLWNDLFSKIFHAIRSIFYGFVAFFTACNRHRLRIFHITRDGISKASRGINLSEDIFAGFNSTMRRGNITHHEYIQVGKGRDVGLNQIPLFEAKVACGNAEQILSRDIYRLGHRFDFFRMLSCYFTTVGFFVSSMVVIIMVYTFLYGRLYMSLSGTEAAIMKEALTRGNTALESAMASQSVVQLGLLMALPMFMELGLERGFRTALGDLIIMKLQLCSVFFTFSLGTKSHYFGRTVLPWSWDEPSTPVTCCDVVFILALHGHMFLQLLLFCIAILEAGEKENICWMHFYY